MDKLLPCPFCGGEAAMKEWDGFGRYVRCSVCKACGAVKPTDEEAIAAWNLRAQPENEPPCYLPEQNNPYPLCVGRGMAVCAHCCIWADYEPEENESRVNRPLTLDELREMVGQPVWTIGVSFTKDGSWEMWDIVERVDDDGVEFGYSTESKEWWNYNLRNNDGTLMGCAWVAYRYKPKEEHHEAD